MQMTFLEAKTDDLENQGRRKNLSIFGIPARAEGNQSLYDFFTNMLPRWLGLPSQKSFTLERVHRTLASGKPKQNITVLFCFLKFREKAFVYQEVKEQELTHKGCDINTFHGVLHNPHRFWILYGNKVHFFSTPQEAKVFYKKSSHDA